MKGLLREALPEIIGGLTVAAILTVTNVLSQSFENSRLLLLIASVVICAIVAASVLWFVLTSPGHMNLKRQWLVMVAMYTVIIFYSGWVGTRIESLTPNRLDEVSVREVIAQDIKLIEDANLSIVDTIYVTDGAIRDCVGTSDTQSDDTVHIGIEEIRERYRQMFGWGWRAITLVDLSVGISDDVAKVSHKGLVVNGQEFFNHPAEYTLRKLGNQWVITSLRIRCD